MTRFFGRSVVSSAVKSVYGADRRSMMDSLERRVLMAATTTPITTTVVDPADGLRLSVNDEKPSVVVGDWATAGNADSWVVTGASSTTVAGGTITTAATAAGTPITLARTGLTAGPQTIEYGYYDYVQVRLQLPASYNGGDVTLNYGTSITVPSSQAAVTSAARSFTIPAAQLATDGQFHVYRIDVGKAVYWEGNLTGLRVSVPVTSGSQTVSLDYVEVGDLPNSTLAVSPTTQHIGNPAGYLEYPTTANGGAYNVTPGSATFMSVQSKHFIYYYDTAANPGGANQVTAAHNTLEQLEQSLRIYTQVLGFKDGFSWAAGLHNGETTRYKLNVTSWFGGYFSGGFYLNVDTSGSANTVSNGYTVNEAPGSPIPHEYGHVTDSQNGAYLAGGHWESHANWYREQWANWYGEKFASVGLPQSAYTGAGNRYSNLRIDNPRLIYNDWRIYTPLQYYATSLGMDANAAAKLWSAGSTNQTIIDKLATLVPAGSSVKDVVGTLMQYWPTLDFPVRAIMKAAAFPTAAAQADFNFQSTSYLEPVADNTGWYRVPAERAPEKYGYMTHVLTPTAGSTSISLTFNGLPSADAGADWRWSLQAVGADGVTRYSPLYGNGATGTLAILPTDTKVMLVVTATPGNTTLDLDSKHNVKQDTQDASRLIYPYEVTMTGAAPATGAALRIAYTRSASGAFRTNPDGSAGGWVDSTATVASTAYVAAGAQVLGTARVQGTARILDFATIAGNATVSGSAIVSGYAVVNGNATVTASARVRDFAMITGPSTVSGNAVVEQYATLNNELGTATVTGNAIARGVAVVQGGTLSGTAIAEYDYTFNWSMSDGTHAGNYPYDGDWVNYYEYSQVKPRGLIAGYRVNESAGQNLFDEFGTLNGQLRGTPTRVNDTTLNSNVLSLNGTNQYAVLDRSLAALTDGTYAMWVNPASATADQPLLYFGSSATSYLKLVARDANGFAHLTISVNGTVQQLVSTAPVPLNAWTHLAVTFAGGVATFYVNGTASGSTAMSFRPTDVLANGAYSAAESLYLGRDVAGGLFTGKLDDVRFYNVALTPAEVASEVKRAGVILGTAYATTPKDFDGSTTTAESGVHSGTVRTFSAWIKPDTSPSVTNARFGGAYYTPIVDSTDERDASGFGNGLGLNNGKFAVRLNNSLTIWDTGIAVTLGQWQKVTLTLSGTVANLYVNGILRATKTYTAGSVNGKNYRIGYGQTTTDTTSRRYFDGQIFDLTIADRVVAPSETTLPVGWSNGDIGSPTAAGSSAFGSNTWSVIGAGTGVITTSDRFQFASTTLTGDGQIDALVSMPVGFGGVAPNTTATSGLMIRTPGAIANTVNAMVSVTPTGSVVFQYRNTVGGSIVSAGTVNGITGPVYLRLVRSGISVSAFYSTNGTTYTQVGNTATIAFPAAAQFGLAVSSKVNGTLVEGVFNNVAVTSSTAPTIATPATLTTLTGNTVALSVLAADPDGESGLTYRWSIVGTPPSPVSFSVNGTNDAKNTVATFLATGTYSFIVSAFDATGQAVYSSPVTTTVVPTPAYITPATVSVIGGGTQQFTAYDQFGQALPNGSVTWSATAGSITAAGFYTAPATGTTATVTASFPGAPSQSAAVSIVAPLAWYKNDNITASTVLTDSSGNGKNGTLATSYASGTGEIGLSLTLIGGSATLPNGLVNGVTNFTVSGWVKMTSVRAWSRLIDFGTGTTSYMFLTPSDGAGNPRFAITTGGNGAEQSITSSTVIPTGVWTFLAVTLNGNVGTMYVNGVAVGTNTGMTLTPGSLGATNRNYIGRSQFSDPTLLGGVDDLRIYGAAASADTITAMYAAGVAAAASVPNTVTAVAASGYRINVGWADNAAAETGYLVERATNAAFTAGLTSVTLAANTTTYADTTVSPNTTYYYRVTALLAGSLTAGPTASPAVTTPANAAPTILTAVATPSPATLAGGTTLTATATDDAGEPALTYTWTVVGTPPGVVTFGSTNGTNAGKSTTAAFTTAGTYTFQIAVKDALSVTTTTTTTVIVAAPAVAPTVESFVINDGNIQRSMIRTLSLTFSAPVTFGPNAIVLSGVNGTGMPISYTLAQDADTSTYVLTLTDPGLIAGSLADGHYQLKVNAAAVTDAVTGAAMAADATYLFHRLFGDADGNAHISIDDFNGLAIAFSSNSQSPAFNGAFDFDGDGTINISDFNQFAVRFGVSI